MADTNVQRTYRMTDAELCMFVSNLVNIMTRDLTDLSPFGITAPKITAFKALGDAFEVFPTDDFMLGDVMIATEDKNAIIFQVQETIRQMALRVQTKWGVNSARYKKLGISILTNMAEDTLLMSARSIHASMTLFLPDLAGEGLTQAMLDDFEDLNESFEQARNTQANKIMLREEKTSERVDKGNELYTYVTKYCNIGKTVYAMTNPAKYNDYVIYTGGPTGLPGKVQDFTFNQIESKFTWDAQINILNYEIESSSNQTIWTNVYIGSENHFDYAAQEGNLFFRCRAVNETGSGVWSDTYNMSTFVSTPHIYNIQYQSDIHKLTILWQIITSHTIIYEVWQSKVPLGLPSGEFTLIGSTPNMGYFIDNPAVNYKYYYYVIATTTGGRSGRSNVVEVEVV